MSVESPFQFQVISSQLWQPERKRNSIRPKACTICSVVNILISKLWQPERKRKIQLVQPEMSTISTRAEACTITIYIVTEETIISV